MKKDKHKTVKKSAKLEAEAYGIDLTLIDQNLKKTPEERICDMSNAANGLSVLRNAVKKAYAK